MNTRQLIKARKERVQALEHARRQMTTTYQGREHIDAVHTPMGQKRRILRYRGVTYEHQSEQQVATEGRELRYRGVGYDVY